MRITKTLAAVTGLTLAACSPPHEPVAPPTDAPTTSAVHLVRWQAPVEFSAQQITATGTIDLAPKYQVLAEGGTAGTDYTVSFWAVRGEERTVHIRYDDGTFSQNTDEDSYLWFSVTDPYLRPDGSAIAMGDSIEITVTVNSDDMEARFAPAGLQFGAPSTLKMWYTGANGDLDGDGSTDTGDVVIETTSLGMYYQEHGAEEWEDHPEVVEATSDLVTASIFHFSGYAVAW